MVRLARSLVLLSCTNNIHGSCLHFVPRFKFILPFSSVSYTGDRHACERQQHYSRPPHPEPNQAEPRNSNVTSPPSPSPRLHLRALQTHTFISRKSQDAAKPVDKPHLGLSKAITEPPSGNSRAKAGRKLHRISKESDGAHDPRFQSHVKERSPWMLGPRPTQEKQFTRRSQFFG